MTPDRWIFPRERIDASPSRDRGVSEESETVYLQRASNFIQELGRELSLPLLCINTAVVYTQRFFVFHPMTVFEKFSVGASALYLATKVEEHTRKVEDVCKVSRKLGIIETATSDDEFLQTLFQNESIILSTLGFELEVHHPHQHVLLVCNSLKASKHFSRTSYILATYCLHLTKMCLMYKPNVIACVCVHTAAKMLTVEILQGDECDAWFLKTDNTLTVELLDKLTVEFLTILKNCPDKIKNTTLTNLVNKLGKDPSFLPSLQSSSQIPKRDGSCGDEIASTLRNELSLIASLLSTESCKLKDTEKAYVAAESKIAVTDPKPLDDMKVTHKEESSANLLTCNSKSVINSKKLVSNGNILEKALSKGLVLPIANANNSISVNSHLSSSHSKERNSCQSTFPAHSIKISSNPTSEGNIEKVRASIVIPKSESSRTVVNKMHSKVAHSAKSRPTILSSKTNVKPFSIERAKLVPNTAVCVNPKNDNSKITSCTILNNQRSKDLGSVQSSCTIVKNSSGVPIIVKHFRKNNAFPQNISSVSSKQLQNFPKNDKFRNQSSSFSSAENLSNVSHSKTNDRMSSSTLCNQFQTTITKKSCNMQSSSLKTPNSEKNQHNRNNNPFNRNLNSTVGTPAQRGVNVGELHTVDSRSLLKSNFLINEIDIKPQTDSIFALRSEGSTEPTPRPFRQSSLPPSKQAKTDRTAQTVKLYSSSFPDKGPSQNSGAIRPKPIDVATINGDNVWVRQPVKVSEVSPGSGVAPATCLMARGDNAATKTASRAEGHLTMGVTPVLPAMKAVNTFDIYSSHLKILRKGSTPLVVPTSLRNFRTSSTEENLTARGDFDPQLEKAKQVSRVNINANNLRGSEGPNLNVVVCPTTIDVPESIQRKTAKNRKFNAKKLGDLIKRLPKNSNVSLIHTGNCAKVIVMSSSPAAKRFKPN